ncbi:hypothetical protein CFP56_036693 [Quercus suber]|uniref:Uncharacterized protein n=1 Tax=Quercus suber TaxID=58331 RepID=A0AAW0MAE2_QUESU
MALHVIQMSCEPDTFSDIREISSARVAWDTLAENYKTNSAVVVKDNSKFIYSYSYRCITAMVFKIQIQDCDKIGLGIFLH